MNKCGLSIWLTVKLNIDNPTFKVLTNNQQINIWNHIYVIYMLKYTILVYWLRSQEFAKKWGMQEQEDDKIGHQPTYYTTYTELTMKWFRFDTKVVR